jgi:hypothetical protein
MLEKIMNDPSGIGIFAACVGLVIWLIKASFKRQDSVTDRYFSSLENQMAEQKQKDLRLLESQDKKDQLYGEALSAIRTTLNEVAGAVSEQTRALQSLHQKHDQLPCQHKEERKRAS